MKADANTEPQLRCDKCGHQEVSSVGLKETVKGSVSIGVQTLKEDRSSDGKFVRRRLRSY